MTPAKSVMILGATGRVGGECLRVMLDDSAFSRVVTLTRRPITSQLRTR